MPGNPRSFSSEYSDARTVPLRVRGLQVTIIKHFADMSWWQGSTALPANVAEMPDSGQQYLTRFTERLIALEERCESGCRSSPPHSTRVPDRLVPTTNVNRSGRKN